MNSTISLIMQGNSISFFKIEKKISCLFLLVFLRAIAPAQNVQLVIRAGTIFYQSGGVVVLNNADVINDGVSNIPNGILRFTGGNNSLIGGTSTLFANTITIDKTGGARVALLSNVMLNNSLNFVNGLVDLNGRILDFSASAPGLQGESEISRITDIIGGFARKEALSVSNPSSLNIGNFGAAITTSANLGNVMISRFHKPASNPSNLSFTGIQRTYQINPANNAGLNATLRFYYLDAELNGKDEATLSLWKSSDNVNWINIGVTTRNTTLNYVEKTGLADFSFWTLTDALNVLPVKLISFKAICESNYANIQWSTSTEINFDHFEIERSNDAYNWISLGGIPAANNVLGSVYNYKDLAPQQKAFYRLKTIDKAGNFSYSPVFSGGCSEIASGLVIYPNPAKKFSVARISVRQPVQANIQLYNMHGQLVYAAQWKLQPGNNQIILPVEKLPMGSYPVKVVIEKNVYRSTLIKQ